MTQYFLLSFFWITYFVLHSLLAANYVKNKTKKSLPKFYPFYRITYNIIVFILLVLVLCYQSKIPLTFIFDTNIVVQIIGYSIVFSGAVLGAVTFKNYSGMEFSGLDFNKQETTNLKLNTSGLNSYVRHPLYFATLLMVWGYFAANPTVTILIMNGIISLYLIIGTKLEEQKLIKEFGNQYKQYIKEVPMLIPLKIKI